MEWDYTVNDYKINAYVFMLSTIETEMLYHDYMI